MSDSKDISALNYIRNNRKVSEDEIREQFGSDGVFVLQVFWSRFSDARKHNDGRSTNAKREDVLAQMEEDFKSGVLKNPIRQYKRHELYANILVAIGVIASVFCFIIFGWAILLFIPPIWIIILLLIWIIKKIN